jgi:hypothetical protein
MIISSPYEIVIACLIGILFFVVIFKIKITWYDDL